MDDTDRTPSYRAEFQEILGKTGDKITALVYLCDGDDKVLSARLIVSRTLMATERVTEQQLEDRAPRLLMNQAADRGWLEQHSGQTDVDVKVTEDAWERAEIPT